MTGPDARRTGDADEPIFATCGEDGASLRCRVCGAVDEIVHDEAPSMAGYGVDSYARCTRCGSVECSDPVFGWRASPAQWPSTSPQEQPEPTTASSDGSADREAS
ncbi:hypothetical protein [Micromonospora sp. CPCC 205556]|uniref:hypothetical protein n=1 Tax=Micromonospora sp. CPCC 205556 TaxID=3122398 RepID=UPI002FF40C97